MAKEKAEAEEKGAPLLESIRVVTALVSPKDLAFSSSKEKLIITGSTPEGSCSFKTGIFAPSDLEDKVMLLDTASLLSALKGKKGVELQFNSTGLEIKAKAYKAVIASTEAGSQEAAFEVEDSAILVEAKGELWDWILDIFLKVKLWESETNPAMIYIRATGKGVFAVAYNTYQMKFAHSKKVTGDCEFSIPMGAAKRVANSLFKGDLRIGENSLVFSSKNARAKLPVFKPELQVTGDQLYAMAVSTPKEKGTVIEFSKAELKEFLDNSAHLLGTQSPITFKAKDNKMMAKVETSAGSTQCVLAADVVGSVEFQVKASVLQDAMEGNSDKMMLTVTDNCLIANQGMFMYRASTEHRD